MGYFVFIDGKKFDRSLLEAANALLDGKTIKKFTLKDAERIYQTILRDGSLSACERRTLDYLLQNYPWTTHGKNWMLNEIEAIPVSSTELAEHIMEVEYGLHHLKFDFDETYLADQNELVNNSVQFGEALRRALQCYLRDGSNPTAVVRFLAALYDIPLTQDEFRALLDSVLKEHFKHATLTLIPQLNTSQNQSNYFYPPEGELVRRNWVFGLTFHDIPNYYFWAIVDRENQNPTYNYGAPVELPAYASVV